MSNKTQKEVVSDINKCIVIIIALALYMGTKLAWMAGYNRALNDAVSMLECTEGVTSISDKAAQAIAIQKCGEKANKTMKTHMLYGFLIPTHQ